MYLMFRKCDVTVGLSSNLIINHYLGLMNYLIFNRMQIMP